MIILEKTRKIEELLKNIADKTLLAKLTQALSPVDLIRRYKQAISNTNLNKVKKPRPTSMKNTGDVLAKLK